MTRSIWALAAAGCLTVSTGTAQGVITWQRSAVTAHGPTVSLDTVGTPVRVDGTLALLFPRLRAAYQRLGVHPDVDDSARGMLGTLQIVRSHSFAGGWMSRVVDCGAGASGPVADNARVQLSLVSFLTPAGTDSSVVRTALVGSARREDGSSMETVSCTSRGYVETWLRLQLAGGPAR